MQALETPDNPFGFGIWEVAQLFSMVLSSPQSVKQLTPLLGKEPPVMSDQRFHFSVYQ